MSFFVFLKENWPEILVLTREHLFIVLVSTGLALGVGLPLGIVLTRVKRLQAPILGFANVMQTVPSLALFGLLIPIPFIGGIGARTAIIALSLYALLPIIRNTVTGIFGIDPKIREAAAAMGMTNMQILSRVELPLAAPVIITGIRVAVVISVGVATVAAAIGAGGLGTYIFRGLRQNDNNLLLAGAVASAVLALLCDLVLGQIEHWFKIGERRQTQPALALAAAGLAFALIVGGSYFAPGASASSGPEHANGRRIVVGSKDFTESVILAEILSQTLEKQGFEVVRQFELGDYLAQKSLIAGSVDVYPEYTGTAYTAILKHTPISDADAVYRSVKQEYSQQFGFEVGPPLGFSNDFAILIRAEDARKYGLKTISDAVAVGLGWQAGFGQDFMSRADGYAGFVKTYPFNFSKPPREMDLFAHLSCSAGGRTRPDSGQFD